jgi:DNA replication protein DnaC
MSGKQKRGFIGLPCLSSDEPFRISVKGIPVKRIPVEGLGDLSQKELKVADVENAILDAAIFLSQHRLFFNMNVHGKILSYRSQQGTSVYLPGGLLLYFLSLILIANRHGSIKVAMETYNGKIRSRNYEINENTSEEMRYGEQCKTAFIMKRFLKLIGELSDIKVENDNVKFGIGALCSGRMNGIVHVPLFITINPMGLSDRFLKITAKHVFDSAEDLKIRLNTPKKSVTATPSESFPSERKYSVPIGEGKRAIKKERYAWSDEELKTIAMILRKLNQPKISKDVNCVTDYINLHKTSKKRFPWKEVREVLENSPELKKSIRQEHLIKKKKHEDKDDNSGEEDQDEDSRECSLYNCSDSLVKFLEKQYKENYEDCSGVRRLPFKRPINQQCDSTIESNGNVTNFFLSKVRDSLHQYHCFGFLLPINCRPMTVYNKLLNNSVLESFPMYMSIPPLIKTNRTLHRVQSYSSTLRNAAQRLECLLIDKFIKISGDSNLFSLETAFNALEKAHSNHMELMTSIVSAGGEGRIEVSHECSFREIDNTFDEAVETTIQIVKEFVKGYDSKTIATLGEIVSSMCFALGKASLEMVRSGSGSIDELFDVWRNISTLMDYFNNGRIFINDNAVYMRKLACFFGRPIFNGNWKNTLSTLEQLCQNVILEQIVRTFRENLGLGVDTCIMEKMQQTSKMADSREGLFDLIINRRSLITKEGVAVVCSRCGRIFSKSGCNHVCLSSCTNHALSPLDKPSYISVGTDTFREHMRQRFASLNKAQQEMVVTVACHDNQNVFITGGPGVGKSHVLKFLRDFMYLDLLVYAKVAVNGTSNIAASLVNGNTIHKFLRLSGNPKDHEQAMKGEKSCKLYVESHIQRIAQREGGHNYRLDYLILKVVIIDETQQVPADLWSFLDLFLRTIRNQDSKPFGGVTIIAFGDVMQLTPILSNECNPQHVFFFQTPAFVNGNFNIGYLKMVERQRDPEFIDIIASVRSGIYDEKKCAVINDIKKFGYDVPTEAISVCERAGEKYKPDERRQYFLSKDRYVVSKWSNSERIRSLKERNELTYSLGQTLFLVTEHDQKQDILEAKIHFMNEKSAITAVQALDEYSIIGSTDTTKLAPEDKKVLERMMRKQLEPQIYLHIGMMVQITRNINAEHPKRSLARIVAFVHENNNLTKITLSSCHSLADSQDGHTFTITRSTVEVECKISNSGLKAILTRQQFAITDASVMLIHNCIGVTIDVPCIYDNSRIQAKDQKSSNAKEFGFLCTAISRCVRPSLFLPLHPISMSEYTNVHPVAKAFDDKFSNQKNMFTPYNGEIPEEMESKRDQERDLSDEVHINKRFKVA